MNHATTVFHNKNILLPCGAKYFHGNKLCVARVQLTGFHIAALLVVIGERNSFVIENLDGIFFIMYLANE